MAETNRQELSKARLQYLARREELLQKKVDSISLNLFDKINEKFLNSLELGPDGKVLNNANNIRAVAQIDSIYNTFNKQYNIPTIKTFIGDMPGIGQLNESYFNEVIGAPTAVSRYRAETVVNEQLGIKRDGTLIKGGFTEKFIQSKEVVNSIKEKTLQGITQGKGFQQLKNDLKETIRGVPKQNTGKLHQYYRNNAYDTYSKVDRLYSDTMAKDLKLEYFYYSGGVIPTTRMFCRQLNGAIIKASDFKKLTFKNLKVSFLKQPLRSGIPDGSHSTWKPLQDLGGYGCRHTKDYVSNSFALKKKDQIYNLNKLVISPISK